MDGINILIGKIYPSGCEWGTVKQLKVWIEQEVLDFIFNIGSSWVMTFQLEQKFSLCLWPASPFCMLDLPASIIV